MRNSTRKIATKTAVASRIMNRTYPGRDSHHVARIFG
jgi:hypothetical protein